MAFQSPKQKRATMGVMLDEYKNSQDDFISQREAYINLNYALSYAHEHDKDKSKQYADEAQKIEKIADEQDKRGTWITNEDTGKKEMIPSKEDEKYMEKFLKENYQLSRELQNEYYLMQNEAKLYEKIKNNKDKGIDKLTPLYVKLQEGQINVKRKYGDEVGDPINSDRFRHSYPNTTKTLEQKVERWAEKENNKEQGVQR